MNSVRARRHRVCRGLALWRGIGVDFALAVGGIGVVCILRGIINLFARKVSDPVC